MKATLATLACLLTVGFLSAASVSGNNTAVVIKKNVVESDTKFQFLCVPVNGLDIANGKEQPVLLSTFLPATTLPAGTTVIFVGNDKLKETKPEVQEDENGVKSWTADPSLPGGQILWLQRKTKVVMQSSRSRGVTTYTTGDTLPTEIVFCGQDRDRTTFIPSLNNVVAMCNDSSEAVKLKDLGITVAKLDTILTLQKGSSDYRQYIYDGAKWIGPANADSDNVEIAPGEAFYYLKRR